MSLGFVIYKLPWKCDNMAMPVESTEKTHLPMFEMRELIVDSYAALQAVQTGIMTQQRLSQMIERLKQATHIILK